jgi:putative transposase
MALDQSVLSELLAAFQSGEGLDLIRESVRLVCQELIETELSALIGAGRYERSDERTNERCAWPVFSPSFWPREVRTPRCHFQL